MVRRLVVGLALPLLPVLSSPNGCHAERCLPEGNPTSLLQLRALKSPTSLDFIPCRLDQQGLDSFDMLDISSGGLVEVTKLARDIPSATTSGILCQTIFHPSIHDRHFLSFAKQGLGTNFSTSFDTEFRRKCTSAYTSEAWSNLWQNYTGSWEHDHVVPMDNAIWGEMGQWLNTERKKQSAGAMTWDQFRNPGDGVDEESEMVGLLRHIASSAPPTVPLTRVLDFGCGDGVELSKLARGLELGQGDALCLDIADYVADEASDYVTKLIAPADTAENYDKALQTYFKDKSLNGTVSTVFSQVTFHHITQPAMRTAALTFIRDSLTEDGFFLLAEWDNPGTPIDYTIYFDLAHYLPNLFFSDPAPTVANLAPLDTVYLSVDGWHGLMGSNGLALSNQRSRLPWTKKDNSTIWMGPTEAADQSQGRNFLAVYGKA